jgi:hypothetical protein
MRTSLTTEEHRYTEIFDNYINGNLSNFRTSIRKLSKINLLKCIDFVSHNTAQHTEKKKY